MRSCKECKTPKSLGEFYKHPSSPGGRMTKCKECHKAGVRANRLERIEYYRAYDRDRGNRQGYGYIKQYRGENRQKYRAHCAVNNAVRDGRMDRPDHCEECGDTCIPHGHHDDYDKPLDVRWLCAVCHRQWHVENGEGRNAGVPDERTEDAA